jgi:four helix bundle protein
MNPTELKERTMQFAVRVLKMADALPKSVSGRTVANQVARSGCSVAANYRAALRAKSRRDFVHKITTVLEEADETAFWIELSQLAMLLPTKRLAKLLAEAVELTMIFNATRTTAIRRPARTHESQVSPVSRRS